MVIFLLVVIAVGVLLLSDVGRKRSRRSVSSCVDCARAWNCRCSMPDCLVVHRTLGTARQHRSSPVLRSMGLAFIRLPRGGRPWSILVDIAESEEDGNMRAESVVNYRWQFPCVM
jgi:hypothetical protein